MGSSKKLFSTPTEQSILVTLLYSDIFSFPLTKDELWQFLLSDKKMSRRSFEQSLKNLDDALMQQDGYFCLKNREGIIAQRIAQLPEVAKKTQLALAAALQLSRIPSIRFIGISGGLAAGKVTKEDDIDFVIIVQKNTLFVSRLLLLLVLQLLGVRRSRNQKKTANTICVNLLFDETAIDWFEKKQDVYIAREIAQILPLFERANGYQQFINANSWIKQFLPNTTFRAAIHAEKQKKYWMSGIVFNPFSEYLARAFQMSLMKRHQTKETITKHLLALHPNDYRAKILSQLRLKMRQLGLLTKF